MKVEFQKNIEDMKLMAIYISQLEREGMAYLVDNQSNKYEVTIKGF